MQAPRILRRVNRAVTNPLVRPLAGWLPPLAVVQHQGRRSGRAYRTPVLAFATEKGYVTPLAYGTDTDWCRNVLAARRCTLEAGGREVKLRRPRIVDAEEGVLLLPWPLRPVLRAARLPGFLVLDR